MVSCGLKGLAVCAVVKTTFELQQAQLTDPIAALQYEHQLAARALEPIEHEPSPAPQAEANPQVDPAYSLPHARESAERRTQGTEDTEAPGTSAAHSKPASLGWGRLKKVKLAAKADGSQDGGSKRKRDADTGGGAQLLCMCTIHDDIRSSVVVMCCWTGQKAGLLTPAVQQLPPYS